MSLTDAERQFLNACVYEATHKPFSGPATRDLHGRGIHYSDLSWILTAFDRELRAQGIRPVGHFSPNPPPSPWPELALAQRRNQELKAQWESRVTAPGHSEGTLLAHSRPRGRSFSSAIACWFGLPGSV